MNKYDKSLALPNECWKPVEGYEGLYAVSSNGGAKSVERFDSLGRLWKERILRPTKTTDGYLLVQLYKDGKRKKYLVHRLVAQAFIPNPDNKPCVNHLDENKTNNHYSNLSWTTPKENSNWGTCQQRRAEKKRGIYNTKKSKAVCQYTLDGQFIKEYPSTMEVHRQLGYNQSSIGACCRGLYKTAYGYKWKYK